MQRYSLPLIVTLLHTLGVLLFVVPAEELFTPVPFITQDYALHYYHTVTSTGFMEGWGRVWGYDPTFMAGYPASTVFDVSFKFGELFVFATPFLDKAVSFKLLITSTFLSIPILLSFTARFFGLKRGESNIFILLSVAFWWFSLYREMVFFGMVSYVFVSYLSLFLLSVLKRYLEKPSGKVLAWLTVLMTLTFMVHILSPIIIVIPALLLVYSHRRGLGRRGVLFLLIPPVVTVIANLFWLIPFLDFRGDIETSIVSYWTSDDPLTFLKDLFTTKFYWSYMSDPGIKGLVLFILAFSSLGLFRLKREGSGLFLPLGIGALFLFFFSYFGSFLEATAVFQPLRYKLPMVLLLAAPAAIALADDRYRKAKVALTVLLIVSLAPMAIREFGDEKPYKIKAVYDAPLLKVSDWIRENPRRGGRVLIEDSGDETGHQYYGVYFPALLGDLTGREFIGGPYPYFLIKHHFATYYAGTLFDKKITQIPIDDFKLYMDLYNINSIVAFLPASIYYYMNFPDYFIFKGRVGKFFFFEVNRRDSYFASGSGTVSAEANRIVVENMKGDEAVIRYHWLDNMVLEGEGVIEPQYLMDDPVPFIKIRGAGERAVILNGY